MHGAHQACHPFGVGKLVSASAGDEDRCHFKKQQPTAAVIDREFLTDSFKIHEHSRIIDIL